MCVSGPGLPQHYIDEVVFYTLKHLIFVAVIFFFPKLKFSQEEIFGKVSLVEGNKFAP